MNEQSMEEEKPVNGTKDKNSAEEETADGFRKINKKAIPVWRLGGGGSSIILWMIPFVLGVMALANEWPRFAIAAIALFFLINTILQFTWLPLLRWRYWRYRLSEHEIELRRGILIRTHTLIPVNRVQHVDTRQGPLMRSYGLATVTISTAATTHEIPALSEDVADEVRSKISNLARQARQDV